VHFLNYSLITFYHSQMKINKNVYFFYSKIYNIYGVFIYFFNKNQKYIHLDEFLILNIEILQRFSFFFRCQVKIKEKSIFFLLV
jgi:hypothetical protein